MDFNFKYKLTEEDYAEYNAYSSWHSNWQKKARLTFAIRLFIYCGISMSATAILLMKLKPPRTGDYNTFIIILILLNLLNTFIYYQQAPYNIKKKAIKLLHKEENQHLLDESELNINDQHIIATDNSSKTNYSWKSIVRYAVTKDFFYLYINSIQAIVIPKRLLGDQKEIDALDKFITEKIPLSSSFRSMGI